MARIENFGIGGGRGGVHYKEEATVDILANLKKLGRMSINVKSSRYKRFLDILQILEYLEP